ncbi:Reverse transcriptase zinc-binding domain [Arabidopsis thaliana x Arabidopsis arenosa]|uniref:Reverse transcriptase zinc-binding domain n=1 Tax=Arabidopsis thaliana x Arabidopsis arenosa TaxID=1240361 RepID=A0A8T2AEK0_9BRAS|nr:Reverse transcriptase zinc-binding domain [Arabidopsis thaliana x Arabidopsis arenosa]
MALPVYSMNCFLLPITICDEIVRVVSSYWWGKDNGKRKISWVAWKRMSLPKKEGGLGFKDLHNFNKALLAKQAWRILTHPSGLLARLYKGLYFPSHTYLQAKTGSQPSYGWKSIQEGKDLLQKGIRCRIGDGKTTKVWEDPWLPTLPPRPANGPALYNDMVVADLWKENQREWDPNIFEGVLNPEDQQLARELYLSKYTEKDTYEWAYTQDARYTVRSGYWVATHVEVNEEDRIEPPLGSTDLKQQVWKSKIGPKIQHFLWRCLSEALPTALHLRQRKISMDPTCQRCCQEEETTNHIIFTCSFAQAVWRCVTSELGYQFTFGNDHEDNIRMLLQLQHNKSLPPNKCLIPFWIMWRIWKSRNDFLFRKINRHSSIEARKGFEEAIEWIEAQQTDTEETSLNTQSEPTQQNRARDSQWEPPPPGWVKCNFDSGYIQGRDFTATGWLIRDANGHLISSGCAKLQKSYSALQAEALGFLHALQIVWIQGHRCVYFEGDNMELVKLINTMGDHVKLGTLLYDIRQWMRKLPLVSLAHVNREKNAAADVLSNRASSINSLYQTFTIPPAWLVNYLYYPFTI